MLISTYILKFYIIFLNLNFVFFLVIAVQLKTKTK